MRHRNAWRVHSLKWTSADEVNYAGGDKQLADIGAWMSDQPLSSSLTQVGITLRQLKISLTEVDIAFTQEQIVLQRWTSLSHR